MSTLLRRVELLSGDHTKGSTTTTTVHTLEDEIEGYLAAVTSGLAAATPIHAAVRAPDAVVEAIFDTLTSREFSYLGRTRTAPYREQTISLLRERAHLGEPLWFSYDIGPGYHASIRPGEQRLRHDVGLAELLILFQISTFCRRVGELYAPGARFWLVIDNLCALRTNDIPVQRTTAYCAQLRALIDETGLGDRVGMIVESELFDLDEYDGLLAAIEERPLETAPSPSAVENVGRFLGRRCGVLEAADRIDRYRRTSIVTESLLARVVRGVRMTQRATGATLGFRPFPGGDSRTQCGEVAICRSPKGRLHPVLLTSRNIDSFDCRRLSFPGLLPATIRHVTFAERAAG